MPNHLHGIIVIEDPDPRRGGNDSGSGGSRTARATQPKRKPLGRLIGAFKTVSTKQINALQDTPAQRFWQRNYHERIIRNERELQAIREYIIHNPLHWALDREHPANVGKGAR